MDLDFDLLDQVLDGLQATVTISSPVQHQVEREQDHRYRNLLGKIGRTTDWSLMALGMETPVICIVCISQTCNHIAEELDTPHVSHVWDTYQLALYGEQEINCNLDYGLHN
ncbi:MAG: hypothetical protein ACXAE3_01550 [Candidatus Kariarchaeaceae archaeon]|jgi:hypothetical protein